MAHGLFCTCRRCNPSFLDIISGSGGKHGFNKKLKNGTNIYGPKGYDKRPGQKHGHSGSGFNRTPHSSIGSAAIGRPHSAKGHTTHRHRY